MITNQEIQEMNKSFKNYIKNKKDKINRMIMFVNDEQAVTEVLSTMYFIMKSTNKPLNNQSLFFTNYKELEAVKNKYYFYFSTDNPFSFIFSIFYNYLSDNFKQDKILDLYSFTYKDMYFDIEAKAGSSIIQIFRISEEYENAVKINLNDISDYLKNRLINNQINGL